MDARVDADRYAFSCRRLENFIPRIYGGAFRRPGMIYTGDTGDQDNASLLLGFNISASARYVLEFGTETLRIWNADGTPFYDLVNGGLLELTTPYAAADLPEVKFVQLNNVAFFVHPNYPVQKLSRTFNAGFNTFEFEWSAVTWDYPCFRSANQTAVTVTPSATTGTITLSFSADVFTETLDYSQYVGARIRVGQRRDATSVKLSLASTATSSEIEVLGSFNLTTYGTWVGTLTIQREDAAGNWEDVKTFSSATARNIVYEATQPTPANLRLSYTATSGGSSTPTAVLEVDDSRVYGLARITSVGYSASLPVVDCVVESALYDTSETTDWALEAWAPYSGYPRSVTFHEQRLWFGGTDLEPNTFWASRVDSFLDFRRGVFDADSLSFTLAATEGSAIQSMLSHDALVLFTQTEEWTATTSENTAITPSNIFVRRQSRFGSASRQAIVAANNILFLQRGSRKLRNFVYSAQEAGGSSDDLSLLAEHITLGGIRQFAFQQQPDPVVWCVTNTGVLLSMTYEAPQNVTAWARHTTAGTVESVAVIYGDGTGSDEVWVSVSRAGGRTVERIDPDATAKLESGSLSTMVYVDGAVLVRESSPITRVQGLAHLEGEEVQVLADGLVLTPRTVSGGEIDLDTPASNVTVGLAYTSLLQPSKIELQLDDGTAQDRVFNVDEMSLNLWKSKPFEYADFPDAPEDGWFDAQTTEADSELFTGQLDQIKNEGRYGQNVNVAVRQRYPLPLNLLAIVARFSVTKD